MSRYYLSHYSKMHKDLIRHTLQHRMQSIFPEIQIPALHMHPCCLVERGWEGRNEKRQYSWQQEKHAKLYFNLFQAQQTEFLTVVSSQQRRL